jgi:SAM-dependent methyltransferase
MGTSNWQNIPFCIEMIRRIDPESVLDVGVGFGRWGFAAREFLEAWAGRPLMSQWRLRVDGIEAFASAIAPYHRTIYSHLYEGDALEVMTALHEQYDLVIFGDVLEHFTQERARMALRRAMEIGRYILLVLPLGSEWPQDEQYGNVYERHLSEWSADQICSEWPVLRRRLFRDYLGRPFGVFVIGAREPDRMIFDLRSESAPGIAAVAEFERDQTLAFAAQERTVAEVRAAWQHWQCQLEVAVPAKNKGQIGLKNIGKSACASGSEVWLLNIRSSLLPFFDFERIPGLAPRNLASHKRAAFGKALLLSEIGDAVTFPVFGDTVHMEFLQHPWSGIVELSENGQVIRTIDLFGESSSETITHTL